MSGRSVVAAMTARLAADGDVAGFVEHLPGGMTQLRSLAFPVSHDLNALWVPHGATQGDLDDAVAHRPARVVAHRPARVVAPDPYPEVSAPPGWRQDVLRVMLHHGDVPPWPDAVLEVAPHDLHEARRAFWHAEVPDADDAEHLARMSLALGAHDSAHTLAVREDGRPVAWGVVIGGSLDDVWTDPAHRRRGHARAITRAGVAAGAWYLTVDDDNAAATALYRDEGFEDAGRVVVLSPGS